MSHLKHFVGHSGRHQDHLNTGVKMAFIRNRKKTHLKSQEGLPLQNFSCLGKFEKILLETKTNWRWLQKRYLKRYLKPSYWWKENPSSPHSRPLPVLMEANIGRCHRPPSWKDDEVTLKTSKKNNIWQHIFFFAFKKQHLHIFFAFSLHSNPLTLRLLPVPWSLGSTSRPPHPGPTSWSQRSSNRSTVQRLFVVSACFFLLGGGCLGKVAGNCPRHFSLEFFDGLENTGFLLLGVAFGC